MVACSVSTTRPSHIPGKPAGRAALCAARQPGWKETQDPLGLLFCFLCVEAGRWLGPGRHTGTGGGPGRGTRVAQEVLPGPSLLPSLVLRAGRVCGVLCDSILVSARPRELPRGAHSELMVSRRR